MGRLMPKPLVPEPNPEVDLFFAVRLRTTAKPGIGRDHVAERFEAEVKLQFGSAVEVVRLPENAQVVNPRIVLRRARPGTSPCS